MSKKRQPLRRDPEAGILIRTLALGLPHGYVIPEHAHDWAQLVYAMAGVMTVHTEHGTWVVPAHRGVWVPSHFRHQIEMSGHVAMRTLYFRQGAWRGMPRQCCVVVVSPLLRELILHAISMGTLSRKKARQHRLIGVLVDQMRTLPLAPLELPWPANAQAKKVAELIDRQPAECDSFDNLAGQVHVSKRTLERLFLAETGLSLGRWRQKARLLNGLRRLAQGESVTRVAMEVGYESPSAFISMFRQTLGTTPSRYFDETPARSAR